jgi:hypothetical protein
MKTLFTLLFVASYAMSLSQSCVFTGYTQADIDNFIVENPTCTVIDGDVLITSDASNVITQFDGFSNITEITGNLIIYAETDPSYAFDFSSFSSLTTIGGTLSFSDLSSNPSIVNLNGFENLTSVGSLTFWNCRALENLDAFNNLTNLELLEFIGNFNSLQSEIFPGLVSLNNLHLQDFDGPQFIGLNNVLTANFIFIEQISGGITQVINFDFFQSLEQSTEGIEINLFGETNIQGFDNLVYCPTITFNYFSTSTDLPNFTSLSYCNSIFLNCIANDSPQFPALTSTNSVTIWSGMNVNLPALQEVNYFEVSGSQYLGIITGANTFSCEQIQSINIWFKLDNLNITSIDAPNLLNVIGNLTITNCPELSTCNYEFICNKIALEPELVDIHDNGIGCSTLVDIASNCGDLFIQGNVFVDMDCDGTFNSDDIAVSHPIILNETNNPIGASTISGDYLYIAQQNTTYTLAAAPILGTLNAAPITLTTGPDNTPFTNNNFALCPDLLYHDLAVTVSSTTMTPGFQSNILFHIENLSYNSETVSLNAVLSLLNVMVINTSSHPYSTSLNTITFDDFTIGAGETITVTLNVTLDASIQLGTLNSIQADVTSGSSEVDLTNNQDSFQNFVTGSYDPNDITVNREAIDYTQVNQDGEWLVYQIRFQNTGNAPAQFINVVNEQDLDLDMSTIDMIAASHSYELIFNGREITWFFDNIQLPDSTTDLLGSQGYILFRIKTNPGITLDEVIESSAAIYFDYNEPVITNTATTVFYVCPESISAAGNTIYCEGETVLLSANTGYDGYNWILDGSIIGTEQTFSADWSAGIYAIEYSGNTLYCISSSVIEIIVNDNPETPSITQDGNTLTASGSGTFIWLYNDQLLNDTDNSIEITASGDYSVSVTANGCTSETSQNNFTYLGINENDLMKMSAFPNPFTDIISLQLPAQTEKITVTDVSGKIVFEKTNIATSSIQLDLSFLEAGSYFITVNSASGAVNSVIVKM